MRIPNSFLAVPLLVAAIAARPTFAEDSPTEAPTRDSVVLTSGRTIRGLIVGEDERFVSIRSDGVLRAYAKASVASIERGTPLPEAEAESSAADAEQTKAEKTKTKAEKKLRRAERTAAGDADIAPLSVQGQAWLTELINRLRSPAADDPMVRKSLAAALQSLGRGALPALRQAADETEGDVASTLRRIAMAIDAGKRRTSDAVETGTAETGTAESGATTDRAPPKSRRGTDVLASLGLRRDQTGAVKDVLREHLRSRRELAADARAEGTAREDVVARMSELRAQTAEALRAVLDADQAAKLDAIEAELFEAIESRKRDAGGRKKAKQAPPQ